MYSLIIYSYIIMNWYLICTALTSFLYFNTPFHQIAMLKWNLFNCSIMSFINFYTICIPKKWIISSQFNVRWQGIKTIKYFNTKYIYIYFVFIKPYLFLAHAINVMVNVLEYMRWLANHYLNQNKYKPIKMRISII